MQLTDQMLAYHKKLAGCVPSTKFHRAAIDGYVDMLCEASRRDTNQFSDQEGLTPTLLAAQRGNLEALRILVGRGGDPELAGPSGGCALHLASARGHLSCVTFLVNFGVNMWALDNELKTAKDLAAIGQHKGVLDFLDQMMAKQSALNTKNVQKLKERAKSGAERRLKLLRKAQLKAIKQAEKDERQLAKLSNGRRLLRAAHSISDIKLVGREHHASPLVNYSLDGAPVARTSATGSVYSSSASSTSSSLGSSSGNSLGGLTGSSISSRLLQPSAGFMRHYERAGLSGLDLQGLRHPRPQSEDMTSVRAGHSPAPSSSGSSTARQANVGWSTDELAKAKGQPRRPKYSDLVAVKEAEVAARLQSAASLAQEKLRRNLPLVLGLAAAAEGSHVLIQRHQQAQHLAKGPRAWNLGGVSRKVNSRTIQLAAQSTCDLRLSRDHKTMVGRGSLLVAAAESGKQSDNNNEGCGRLMSRTVSEPDFAAALQGTEAKSNWEESKEEYQTGQRQSVENSSSQAETRDQTQHELLLKCLTQLRIRHEAIQSQQPVASAGEPKAQTPLSNQNSFVPSDELLQHQITAGRYPLRPSVIKQQQKQQQQQLRLKSNIQQTVESRSFGSESIGSAGSLARRTMSSDNSADLVNEITDSASPFSSQRCDTGSGSDNFVQSTKLSAGQLIDSHHEEPFVGPKFDGLHSFLQAIGLLELGPILSQEKIDLDALILVTEEDLKSLDILLGPRRKLLNAIETKLRRQPSSDAGRTSSVASVRGARALEADEACESLAMSQSDVVVDTHL